MIIFDGKYLKTIIRTDDVGPYLQYIYIYIEKIIINIKNIILSNRLNLLSSTLPNKQLSHYNLKVNKAC